MTLDAGHKGLIIAALALLAIAGYLGSSWLSAHDAQVKLTATLAAQKTVIDQAQKDRDAHAAADKVRDAQTAATIESMQKALGNVQTPAQIAAWLPKQLPSLPQPITIQMPAATAQNPAPAATASIPVADLPALRDQLEQCRECAVKLATAQQDVSSRDAQLKLAGEQLSALQRERDAAVTASKGGGFWPRVKRGVKFFVIGAAAGAVALCGTGHCK